MCYRSRLGAYTNVAWRSLVLGSSEKTIAILGDTWWPRTAKQEGDKVDIYIQEFLSEGVRND